MFEFDVVPGTAVANILHGASQRVIELVRATYLLHEHGDTINPDSYFLRFPGKPRARIIALPAYVGGAVDTAGIKWISSFPGNIDQGVPRASAVLILNDYATGHPVACLESAGISAARTAASAAVAAAALADPSEQRRIAFVGAGVIGQSIADYLAVAGFRATECRVLDLDPAAADRLAGYVGSRFDAPSTVAGTLADALACELVVFATTAATPHVGADTALRPGQLLLNISLRDLAPELLLAANNIVDDVEHCLKADTSPHLAEQLTGSREFVTGTIGGVLQGETVIDPDRPTIVSPFGLGVLDIAVGHFVWTEARRRDLTIAIPGFFGRTRRW